MVWAGPLHLTLLRYTNVWMWARMRTGRRNGWVLFLIIPPSVVKGSLVGPSKFYVVGTWDPPEFSVGLGAAQCCTCVGVG